MTESTSNSTTHVVVIFKDDREEGNNPYRIAPSTVIGGKNDFVFFKNMTDLDVEIKTIDKTPFNVESFIIKPNDHPNPNNRKGMSTAKIGDYRYNAICQGKKARGTKPIIIIYDK